MGSPKQQEFFFGSLYRTTVQVLDVFNDFKVRRFNRDMSISGYVKVPIKYYPKKKMMMDIADPNITFPITFPQMTLEKDGNITYRKEDDAGILDEKEYSYTDGVPASASYFAMGREQPVTVPYKLSIWCTNETDLDQLIEAISFWFRPYVVVRFRHPHIPVNDPQNLVDVKLEWDGNIPLSKELDKSQVLVYTATLSFKADTYIFGDKYNGSIVYKIFANYYTASQDEWLDGQSVETQVTFVTGGSGSWPDWSTLTTIPTGGPISGDGWMPPSGWDAWVGMPYLDKGNITP